MTGAGPEGEVEITVNGAARRVPADTSVAGLVELLGLRADQVAVEHNANIVRRDERGARALSAGDVVEVVTLVGGG